MRGRPLDVPNSARIKSKVEFGRTPIPLGNERSRAKAFAAAAKDAPDARIYGSAKAHPAERAELVSVQRLCGYDIAIVRLYPVQYVPAKGELLQSRRIRLELGLTPQPSRLSGSAMPRRGGPQAARVAAFVHNPEMMAEYGAATQPSGPRALRSSTYDYLLITSADLLEAFQPLLEQKVADGLSVKAETVESICASPSGKDNPEKIRNYIKYACDNWGIQYVLLGGDASVVPVRRAYGYVSSAGTVSNIPTDLYYACLDGTWNNDGDGVWGEPNDGEGGGEVDLLAEVYVGRAPVETGAEVTTFVSKIVSYAKSGNPNVDKALFLGEYLGQGIYPSQGGDALDTLLPSFSAYSIQWLDDRPEWSAQWTSTDCIKQLNNSPHIVVAAGHGNQESVMRLSRASVDALTNQYPFLVNSIACDSGDFTYSDCIGEHFSRGSSHGAFAVIMNTSYGWFDAFQTWKWSGEFQGTFFNRLLTQGIPQVGRALQLSREDIVGSVEKTGDMPYRWCYYDIALLGDPATAMKTFSTATLTVKSFNATSGVNDYFPGVTITVSPTPDGTTPFTRRYANGAVVTLTAAESSGSLRFQRWQLDGVEQPDRQQQVEVALASDRTAVAVYEDAPLLSLVQTPDPQYVRPGQTVTVKLHISNLKGRAINSVQALLEYDTSRLGDPKSVTPSSSPPWSAGVPTGPSYDGGKIDYKIDIAGSTSADAEVAVLTFTAGATEGAAYVRFRADEPGAGKYTKLNAVPGNTDLFPVKQDAGTITIDGTSPTVTVVAPNGGDSLLGGSLCDIEWQALDDYPSTTVLQYSSDGGGTWTTIDTLASAPTLPSGPPGTLQYSWNVPFLSSNRCLVKVVARDKAGNVGEDVSDSQFTIDSTAPEVAISSVKQNGVELLGGPPAARGMLAIQVAASDALTGLAAPPTVTLTFADNSTANASYVNQAPAGTFNYAYTLTAATPSGTCRVDAQATDQVGNTGSAPQKQFAINVRVLTATVQLEGYTGSPGAALTLRFALSNAAGVVMERRDVVVSYTHGGDTEAVQLELIPAGVAMVSCKEIQHFLRRRVGVTGTEPSLAAAFTGSNMLLGGDYNGDNFVEVTDFAQFLRDFGRTDRPESDINGDGVVDIIEFGYIANHFFVSGDPE